MKANVGDTIQFLVNHEFIKDTVSEILVLKSSNIVYITQKQYCVFDSELRKEDVFKSQKETK